MDRSRGKRRSKVALDRGKIARTALQLIDRDGLSALSMRRVAAQLHVDPMTLYRFVPNRDAMTRDIVALLLDEMDTSERPGETWDETMKRVSMSELDMALRHPHAFPLVALAQRDEEPVLSHARKVMELALKGGLPEDEFFDVWLVDGAFTDGFLQLATAAMARPVERPVSQAPSGSESDMAARMGATLSREAFARGLNLIYTGLKDTFSIEQETAQKTRPGKD